MEIQTTPAHPRENDSDHSEEDEPVSFDSDDVGISMDFVRAGSIRFTGIHVARNDEIPDGSKLPSPESKLSFFAMEILHEIRYLMLDRPIVTTKVLQELINYPSRNVLEEALPYCGYMFTGGP